MTFRNEEGTGPGRVVLGVDTTLSGLQAVRSAVAEARRRGAALHAVRAWGAGPVEPPASSAAAGLAGPMAFGHGRTDELPDAGGGLAREAEALIVRAFVEIMGGEPPDVTVQPVVLPDAAGPVLVEYACRAGDLLVIGAGHRSWWRRPRGSPVVRYCLRRASCPVLVVPPPPLTRAGSPRSLLRQLRRELDQLTDGGGSR
ncbi:universal stress protein [Natronosporangium hydrolyticum]|uniref:Universal stress protein n=1 Tax=Natronosporangium hydrolyticum TaxID=2811111 RepID=A0A895YKK0_9ACTN|nr:universal stress protein [Natronosporangium hydrolyticum]QSB16515.1 universal stress protein [Natronosporangium hydrolyticum]